MPAFAVSDAPAIKELKGSVEKFDKNSTRLAIAMLVLAAIQTIILLVQIFR